MDDLVPYKELSAEVIDKVMGWLKGGVAMVPNLIVAAAIVTLGGVVARVAQRVAHASLRRALDNEQLANLGAQIVRVGVIIGATFVALGILQLDKTVTSLLAGVGVIGLALGFAFQDIAANFMAGVMMASTRPIRHGDLVQTNGFLGEVTAIELRSTTLRTATGETVRIPNKDVFGTPLINYTDTPLRRVDLACGVSYADDLAQVEQVVRAALDDLPGRAKDRDLAFAYTGFGGSSIDFMVGVWLETPLQSGYVAAKSEMLVRIKRAFDAHGISIPFPIRTLDFGILGGKRLDEVLPQPLTAADVDG